MAVVLTLVDSGGSTIEAYGVKGATISTAIVMAVDFGRFGRLQVRAVPATDDYVDELNQWRARAVTKN